MKVVQKEANCEETSHYQVGYTIRSCMNKQRNTEEKANYLVKLHCYCCKI